MTQEEVLLVLKKRTINGVLLIDTFSLIRGAKENNVPVLLTCFMYKKGVGATGAVAPDSQKLFFWEA